MENFDSVTSKTTLHGNTLLIRLEAEIGVMELNVLSTLNFKDNNVWNNPSTQKLMNALSASKKVIIKISDDVIADRELKKQSPLNIGDSAIFNNFATPIVYNNIEDIHNVSTVIEDFKYDNKDKKLSLNNGIKYKVHLYYIYESQFLIVTNPNE